MIRAYFFQLLGHVYLAAHTAHDMASALTSAGLGADFIKQGIALGARGEALLDRRVLQYVEDKNLGHCIHASIEEVEMWHQTVRFMLRKAGVSAEQQAQVLGHDVHAPKHTVTAIAQALRVIGVVRTDAALRAAMGGDEVTIRDTLVRGNTLLKKLYKVTDDLVTPSSVCPAHEPIHGEIDELIAQMSAWLGHIEASADKLDDATLGKLGFLPVGRGMPVGGTAFGVTLHERAIRQAPDPAGATRTSGWAIGRQGNRENLGQGWT